MKIALRTVLIVSTVACAAAAPLTIHNPSALARRAALVTIPHVLLPAATDDLVAVANGEIAPLQVLGQDGVTVLDLPAKAEISLVIRPRQAGDPPWARVARATVPVKSGKGYREVPHFVVPPTHVIHDPLLPIEGAGWESDEIGYRVYLDRRNAVDVYGKKLPAPVLQKIGQGNGSYHDEAPWGMDIWHVGDSLGAGGLGVLRGRMADQIGAMKRMTADVVVSGPVVATLRVSAQDFTVDGKRHDLTADYSIAAGSRLSMVSASASRGTPLVAGFAKWPDTTFIHATGDDGWGYMADWGRQSENGKDVVGAALFYPVSDVSRTGDDGRSYYVVFKNPVHARYAFAGVWIKDRSGIRSKKDFAAFVARTARELSDPVTVTR